MSKKDLPIVIAAVVLVLMSIGGPLIAQALLVLLIAVIVLAAGYGAGKAAHKFEIGLIVTVVVGILVAAFAIFGWLDWLFDLFGFIGTVLQWLSGFVVAVLAVGLAVYGLSKIKWK